MVMATSRQLHLIPIPVPPVKPLLRRTVKRFLRLVPSVLLLLFVFSLIFVTLMQIAVIHANRRFTFNKVSTTSPSSASSEASISPKYSSLLSSISSSTASPSVPMSPSIGSRRQVHQIQASRNSNNVPSSQEHHAVDAKVSNSTVSPNQLIKEPKKSQLLSIEASLDKTTASRDQSNSNSGKNSANDERVKKIINSIKYEHKFGQSTVNNSTSLMSFRSSSSALSYVPKVSSSSLINKNSSMDEGSLTNQVTGLKRSCPQVPEQLVGRTNIDLDINSDKWVADESMWHSIGLKDGGSWEPINCYALHRVAIIIPYRDRFDHLRILLHHLHPILQRQLLNYKIYVIEQSGNETFNKGVLMNAGVKEALKDSDFHCFIFHDVDLIPEDDRNLYSCPSEPRHLSVAVDKFNYSLPYAYLVGGVFAITKDHFTQVNGYSNLYWGWGGEDDDIAFRLKFHNLNITRPPESIGRYTMIKHSHRAESPDIVRNALLRMAKRRATRDGLNSVRYTVVGRKEMPNYCHITIEIDSVHRWSFPSPNKLVIHF